MKKIVLGILMLAGVTAFAQDREWDKDKHHKNHFEKVKKELKLSEKQATAWTNLQEEYKPKVKSIFKNEDLSREQKKEQLMALHKEKNTEMKSILSDEQIKMLEEKRKEGFRRGKGHRKGFENLKEELNLSDAQVAKFKEVSEKYRPEMKKIMDNETMDRDDKRKEIKAIRKDMQKDMDKILTKDQKKLLKEKKEKWGKKGKKGKRGSKDRK